MKHLVQLKFKLKNEIRIWFSRFLGIHISKEDDIRQLSEQISHLKAQVSTLENFEFENAQKIKNLNLLMQENVNHDLILFCAEYFHLSKSQPLQDLIAAFLVGEGGYYCEVGASDGTTFSNTHMLEKIFKWNGILAEPGRNWHAKLAIERKCNISKKCIYSVSGKRLLFSETHNPLLSTISAYANGDSHREFRKASIQYEVESSSLFDLFVEFNAPENVDFLSLDTEGSEYEIISNFDFSKYSFGLLCVEHNFGETRESVRKLLIENGYHQVLESVSLWDDWYVSSEYREKLFPGEL